MNANSTFSIGKDHQVNEDYALSYSGAGVSYAIISDGCSASPDVDFGARCLAMSAKRELQRHNLEVLGSDLFGDEVVRNAYMAMDLFPYLSPQFLDATLLMAYVKNGKLTVFMYGDGVMVHRRKDWTMGMHVELTSGAPDYLSYRLDPLRMQAYRKIENNTKEIIIREGDKETKGTQSPLTTVIYTTDVQDGDVIAVISDGINSFRKADNTPIPWQDLIDEFTGYKTTEGEFVLRRISAFKRKCLKEGIIHSDDISIGAIVI
jgi:hypothetical protein